MLGESEEDNSAQAILDGTELVGVGEGAASRGRSKAGTIEAPLEKCILGMDRLLHTIQPNSG